MTARLGSCALCSSDARYTCPGCSVRTCSLACSNKHKSDNSCTGIRNPAAYVAPNQFGEISMWRDYGFLQGIGRKVDEWSKGDDGRPLNGPDYSNRILAAQKSLKGKGVELVLGPPGMEKRQSNRTCQRSKKKDFGFSLSFCFHANSSTPQHTIVTHGNSSKDTIVHHLHSALSDTSQQPKLPRWCQRPTLSDYVCFLVKPYIPSSHPRAPPPPTKPTIWQMDTTVPLLDALRFTSFFEWPELHFISNLDFTILQRKSHYDVLVRHFPSAQPISTPHSMQVDELPKITLQEHADSQAKAALSAATGSALTAIGDYGTSSEDDE